MLIAFIGWSVVLCYGGAYVAGSDQITNMVCVTASEGGKIVYSYVYELYIYGINSHGELCYVRLLK